MTADCSVVYGVVAVGAETNRLFKRRERGLSVVAPSSTDCGAESAACDVIPGVVGTVREGRGGGRWASTSMSTHHVVRCFNSD